MAIRSLQVTNTGSAVQLTATPIYCRWFKFQNTAAATMRVGGSDVTASKGFQLAASTGSLDEYAMRSGEVLDLSQWWVIGTNTQILDVIYDSVNQ